MSDKLLACIEQELRCIPHAPTRTSDEKTEPPSKKRKQPAAITSASARVFIPLVEGSERKENKEAKEGKESKDTSRIIRTKAEAIQLLQIAEAKLTFLTQSNDTMNMQLAAASSKIVDLENQLNECREKTEQLLKQMIAKSEDYNSLLLKQSMNITNKAVDAILPTPIMTMNPNDDQPKLRDRLITIQNECQLYLPRLPSLHEIQKPPVQERYKKAIHDSLLKFDDRHRVVLKDVLQRNSDLYAMDKMRVAQLSQQDEWMQQKQLTEISLYCIKLAVQMFDSMPAYKPRESQESDLKDKVLSLK